MLVQATNPSALKDPLADSDDDIPRITQSKKVTRLEDDDGDIGGKMKLVVVPSGFLVAVCLKF